MKPMQDAQELDAFGTVLAQEQCRSYLEIGSKFGSSLRRIASFLPKGSRIVSVDLPNMPATLQKKVQSEKDLEKTITDLQDAGYDAHLIWGDSTAPATIEKVRMLGPFDAIFIDADHTLPYVTQDWTNYAPMARIVAFHDIAWRRDPGWSGNYVIEVPGYWNELKKHYRHVEIKYCKTSDNGIGVLWRI